MTRCPWIMTSLFFLGLFSLAGCGQRPAQHDSSAADSATQAGDHHDHDHDEHTDHSGDHDQPQTFATAVAALKDHYQEIKTAFEADNPQAAHDPLHIVGGLLEALPELSRSANLDDEQAETVQEAVDKMLEAYGTVDEAMHHGEEPDYGAVAESVDENMKTLEDLADQSKAAP